MATTTLTRPADFVLGLELAPAPRRVRTLMTAAPWALRLTTEQPSAKVNAGSIVSFVAGLDGQAQSDALNSTLLAQLNSDHMYDREKQTQEWYRNYTSVLGKVGWVIQGFQFQKYNSSSQGLTMDKVVAEILQSMMTGNELAVALSAITALTSLAKDDGRVNLFGHSTSSSSGGSFQLASATQENGVVAMNLGAFYTSYKTSQTNVLWWHYKSADVDIYKSGQGVTLNNDVYKQVRQPIIDKLGDKASTFIADLPI